MSTIRFVLSLLLIAMVTLSHRADARAGEIVAQVVAVVNQKLILQSDVDEIVDLVGEKELEGLEGDTLTEATRDLTANVVEGLIGQELMEQAMDRGGVEVGDREVESAISDVARQNKMSVPELMEQLQRQGMEPQQYRVEMRKQIRQYRFMELEIRSRVSISDEDVRAHFKQSRAAQEPTRAWRLQRILLAIPKDADEAARVKISDEAAMLLTQLHEGKDFGEVARVRSDDPGTRDAGGEAGIFKRKDLSDLFREALEAAEVGVAVRVDTPRGIFLLRVAEEVDSGQADFEEQRAALTRTLHDSAMERELELWTAEQRRQAHVEIFL
jgi:parvulin-like peptidyl-prolyl isomerase